MDTYLAFLPLSRKLSLPRSAPAALGPCLRRKKGKPRCALEVQPRGPPLAFSNNKGLSVAVAVFDPRLLISSANL